MEAAHDVFVRYGEVFAGESATLHFFYLLIVGSKPCSPCVPIRGSMFCLLPGEVGDSEEFNSKKTLGVKADWAGLFFKHGI